jgi:hypothetical protein
MTSRKKYRFVFSKLLERLPSSYPKPKLIIHSSLKKLSSSYWEIGQPYDKNTHEPPVAWCNVLDNTVHVAATSLISEDKSNILFFFLHEIGHIYAHNKYGVNDPRWLNDKVSERYADNFAARWSKKLIMEGFL